MVSILIIVVIIILFTLILNHRKVTFFIKRQINYFRFIYRAPYNNIPKQYPLYITNSTIERIGNFGDAIRLGNHIFQINMLRYMSKKTGRPFKLIDNWSYNKYLATPIPVVKLSKEEDYYNYIENNYSDININQLPCDKHWNFIGHFEDTKYIENLDENKEIFKLNPEYQSIVNSKYDSFVRNKKMSIGLHVRRGDFNSLWFSKRLLPFDYYKRAIYKILSLYPNINMSEFSIIVCSDDIKWCKSMLTRENLNINCDINYSDLPVDILDMHLLAKCDCQIISNSTFSWWACALSDSKIVINSADWFKEHWKLLMSPKNSLLMPHWINI